MHTKKLSWHKSVWAVLHKDLLCEFRTRYAFGALAMFALVTLSSVSMTVAGLSLPPPIAAMLLWVIIFFCAMAGLSKTFVQEHETGTLLAIRFIGNGQAVLAGKLLFNILLLQVVTILLFPLFIIFINIEVQLWSQQIFVLFLGTIGIAATATMTSLLIACTEAKGSLFTVITFPVLLPLLLMCITATGQILANIAPGWHIFCFLAGYDVTIIVVSSLLFDYLWYA